MTGRERLERTIDGLPVDRIPITTILDETTRRAMPAEWRNISAFEFFRKAGYDQLQFGDMGFREGEHTISPFRLKHAYTVEREVRGNVHIERRIMDGKSLEIHMRDGHPVKHPVTTEEELELLCKMYEAEEVVELTGSELAASLASYDKVNELIGDNGIYIPVVSPSGTQHMLEYECGLMAFYDLLDECPELMERTIEAIQRQRQRQYELLAKHLTFAKTIIPVENTSSLLISPSLYRKYTLPHMQKYARTMREYDKKVIIHMCGALLDLLPEFKEIGLDGIHALTPPPVGTCPFETALDELGENLVVLSGFDTSVLRDESLSREAKIASMRDTMNPRVKAGNFALGIGADGIETSMELFDLVRDAILQYGTK